ncbi:MAG: type VI secretion system-associated protein TagO [Wohlfahrtiimonas sp.]
MRTSLMFILFVFSFVNAQDCSKIEVNDERLACYDSLNKKDNVEDNEKAEDLHKDSSVQMVMNEFIKISDGKFKHAQSGLWVISNEISPVDDSQVVTLVLFSSDLVRSRLSEYRAMMVVRCSSNQTDVFFNYGAYLGSDNAPVTYRIDKEKAISTRWDMSNDGKGAFVRKPIQFIKNLFGKDSLYVSITPYSSNSLSTTFDVVGLSESIEPLREACGW